MNSRYWPTFAQQPKQLIFAPCWSISTAKTLPIRRKWSRAFATVCRPFGDDSLLRYHTCRTRPCSRCWLYTWRPKYELVNTLFHVWKACNLIVAVVRTSFGWLDQAMAQHDASFIPPSQPSLVSVKHCGARRCPFVARNGKPLHSTGFRTPRRVSTGTAGAFQCGFGRSASG